MASSNFKVTGPTLGPKMWLKNYAGQ